MNSRPLSWTVTTQNCLLALAGFVAVFPFLWLVQMSFKTQVDALAFPPKFVFTPTLQNYAELIASHYPSSLVDSTVVACGTTALALLLGAPAGYALSRATRRNATVLGLWILSVRMAPGLAFAIPLFLVYRATGLYDTRQGLILVDLTFALPLVIWLARAFFNLVPRALEEAAYIDGAGLFGAFLRVALPIATPGLVAAAVLSFLEAWNDFFFALILTRREVVTMTVAVVNFMNYQGWEWGRISAGASLIMLPVVVLGLASSRYLVSGLAAGALRE